MIDLDALWARHAAGHPAAEGRPDFRIDPEFCRTEGVPAGAANRPTNLYRKLRQKHSGIDKVLQRLVTDLDINAAMAAGEPGGFELAFELIALGAPVDERVSNFSKSHYLHHNPEVWALGLDPLHHYVLHGPRENRWTLEAQRQMERPGKQAFDPAKPTCMIVVHEMSMTGAPVVGLDLAREAAQTHNVIVAALRDGPLLEAFAALAVFVLVAPKPMLGLRYAECLRRTEVAFAIVNSAECTPFVPWLVGAQIPFLSYIHEYADYVRPRSKATHLALFSDILAFSSETLRSSWRGILADLNIADRDTMILPQRPLRAGGATEEANRDARAELSRALGRDLSKVRLICGAGQMQWRKGTDLFATAAMTAKSLDPDSLFVWIGGGINSDDMTFGVWMHYLASLAGVDDAGGNIAILPSGPLYRSLLAASDAMFLSSRLDPLPNVVFDAVDAGCHVVLFDNATGFDDEVYRASGLFTYVPYADAAAAATALLELPRKEPLGRAAEAGASPPLFRVLSGVLSEHLARRRYFVVGRSAFDAPILYAGGPEHRNLRAREHEKVLAAGRRMIWRDLRDIRDELDRSGNWAHEATRIESYARTSAQELPPFNVHIHAYYIEELPELLRGPALLRHAKRIVVTTDTDEKARRITEATGSDGTRIEVHVVPNRGRDVLPFLNLSRATDDSSGGDDLWCHVHIKRSIGVAAQGEKWRDFLFRILLGTEEELSNAPLLIAQSKTGLVAPLDPYILSWTASRPLLPKFEARLGRPLPEHPLLFPMGNMFWVRGAVVDAMNRLFGQNYPWPNEPIPTDGTEYHLIERLWPTVAASCGLESVFLHKPGERRA